MSKPQHSRNDYRNFKQITLRWKDNDIYGHVNNVNYYSYFDTAANSYLIEAGGFDIHNAEVVGFVVASNCQYVQPISFPGNIDLGLRVNKLGNSSVEYGLAIFKEGENTASAHGVFTHVFVNRAENKATAIPTQIRQALEAIQVA